jgi:hypothetical protein
VPLGGDAVVFQSHQIVMTGTVYTAVNTALLAMSFRHAIALIVVFPVISIGPEYLFLSITNGGVPLVV